MTVHKAQGSKFDRILLILPDQASPVLTREMLYTAVTRARTRVEIWARREVIEASIEKRD
jgi:exodeoxyribonuclease V alpha subunit